MFNINDRVCLKEDTFILADLTLKKGLSGTVAHEEYGPNGLEAYMIDFDYGNSWLVEPEDIKPLN